MIKYTILFHGNETFGKPPYQTIELMILNQLTGEAATLSLPYDRNAKYKVKSIDFGEQIVLRMNQNWFGMGRHFTDLDHCLGFIDRLRNICADVDKDGYGWQAMKHSELNNFLSFVIKENKELFL